MKYPKSLLRSFTNEEYASDFIRGFFRIGKIKTYKTIEDSSRKDETESLGKLQIATHTTQITYDINSSMPIKQSTVPGIIEYTHFFGTPTYILCTSGPQVNIDYLKKKMGQYTLRINNPYSLLQDLRAYFYEQTKRVLLERVRYDKNEVVTKHLKHENSYKLSFTQKPREFKPEQEYRYIVIIPPPQDQEYLYINLNKTLDYVQWHK